MIMVQARKMTRLATRDANFNRVNDACKFASLPVSRCSKTFSWQSRIMSKVINYKTTIWWKWIEWLKIHIKIIQYYDQRSKSYAVLRVVATSDEIVVSPSSILIWESSTQCERVVAKAFSSFVRRPRQKHHADHTSRRVPNTQKIAVGTVQSEHQ